MSPPKSPATFCPRHRCDLHILEDASQLEEPLDLVRLNWILVNQYLPDLVVAIVLFIEDGMQTL
jgi:hypothetical protein